MTPAAALAAVRSALADIPPAEWVAVALALAYLLLAIRQSAWCWACAAASAALYYLLFSRAGLDMQAALQVFYVVMSAYGWWAWRRAGAGAEDLPVSCWGIRAHVLAWVSIVAVAVVNGWIVGGLREGWVPYVDAFVAWASVLATWMVARKVLENWLYWIVADSVAAGLYWSQGFLVTTGLFILYAVLAARGYVAWRRDLRRSRRGPASG